MAYTVTLWDKSTIVLTDKQADTVKQAKLNGIKSLSINGEVYDTSSIAKITKGGSLPIDKSKLISEGNRRQVEGEGYKKFQEMRAKLLRKM